MEAEGARRRRWLDAQHAQRDPVYREMHIAVAHSVNSAHCQRDETKAVRLGRMQRSETIETSEINHKFRTY